SRLWALIMRKQQTCRSCCSPKRRPDCFAKEIRMKAETFDYLLEWTSELHITIADRMDEAITAETDQRSRWLLEYVAGHERDIARKVDQFRAQASEAESKTWLYEHIGEDLPPRAKWELTFADKDFNEINEQ